MYTNGKSWAISFYKKALDMSRENDYARRYTVIFGEMAWSMLREIEKGERESKDKQKAENICGRHIILLPQGKKKN